MSVVTRDASWRALRIAAVVIVGLGVLTVRVIVGGEAELRASDAALDSGSVDDAVVHARRAASFYAPGAPHVSFAYRRLIALAVTAEERHLRDTAVFAWRAVRQAALDTRWLVTPHEAERERAEREIARLVALGVHENAGPDRLIEARQLALMRRDEGPRVGWIVVLIAGVVAASGGLVAAIRASAGAGGRLDWSSGKRPLAVAMVGIVAWLLAWWQA